MKPKMNLILGVAFVVIVVIGTAALWVVGKRVKAANMDAFHQEVSALCAPLGLQALPRGELWVPTFACAGEYAGSRALVILVPNRTNQEPFKARVELILDTAQLAGLKGNVQQLNTNPTPTGPEGQALLARVSPEVRAAAEGLQDPRLIGMALLGKGSVLDLAIRVRWPEGLNTVAVYAWLPREAGPAEVRAGLDQLARVRDALAKEIGP